MTMNLIVAKTVDGQWHPGIGDPSLGGWLTVAAYFVTAVLCGRAGRNADNVRLRWFWLVAAGVLILIGINKQLDLQTWFTEVGRRTAIAGGWYDERAFVQEAFIVAISLLGAVALLIAVVFLRTQLAEVWLAVAGACFLVVFVIVRAMSFHHVDRLLGLTLGNLRLNWLLELGGILAIALVTFRKSASRKTAK